MEFVDAFIQGIGAATSPENLLYCFFGVFLGTLIGVLPGLSSLTAIALILPVTFNIPVDSALMMIAGIYYGSEYGGSITSILLNIPGHPASAISCQDGYPMARSGRAGQALILTAATSFVGGLIGIALLLFTAELLMELSFSFGAREYTVWMIFALLMTASSQAGKFLNGCLMIMLGASLSFIGTDIQTGIPRLTFDIIELREGISVSLLAISVFGISEVMYAFTNSESDSAPMPGSWFPTRREWFRSLGPCLRGSLIGGLYGAIPGVGTTASTVSAYSLERAISKRPQDFGKGMVEGLVAPESANNSAAQTAFIPTLMFGIPGSASMALVIVALTSHGVNPSPTLPLEHPLVFWGLIASFLIGNIFLLVLNIPLIGIWVSILRVPPRMLYPFLLAIITLAGLSISGSLVTVLIMIGLGLLGFLLRIAGFSMTPLLIAFVLAPLIEENYVRSMAIAQGDINYLFGSAFSLVAWGCIGMLLLRHCFKFFKKNASNMPGIRTGS